MPLPDKDPKPWHYAALGLPDKASTEAVKKAYKKLVMKYHPDKVVKQEGESDDAFEVRKADYADKAKKINEAYSQLV